MAERVLGQVAVEMDLKNQKFMTSIRNTTAALRLVKSEMRANASQIAFYGSAFNSAAIKEEAFRVKQQGLIRELQAQENQMRVLQRQFNNSITEQGKWSLATSKYATQINNLTSRMYDLKTAYVENAKGMAKMRAETMGISGAINKVGKASISVGSSLRSVGSTMTQGVTVPIAAGFAYAAKKVVAFDNTMNENKNLIRASGESARETSENVKKMAENAEVYSNKYGISQQKIANGYQDLIKRGYTSKQALGSMNNELKASIATGDSFSDVVKVASQTIESFGMRTSSTKGMVNATNKVLNQLAYASDLTATTFQDTGVAMSYVGASAHQAGFKLSETAAAIGILSNNGLEADKAGTGLRKTIISLNQAASKIDSKNSVLARLGVKKEEIVDSNGKLKDLATILDVINKHIKESKKGEVDKGQVFQSLFGTTGRQAGTILAENTSQLRKLSAEVQNSTSQDYIGKLSRNNLKSAQNQIKIFRQQITNAGMDAARILLPYVTKFIKGAEDVLKAFNKLSDGQKQAVVNIALTAAALGPLSIALGSVLGVMGKVATGSVNLFSKISQWHAARKAFQEISVAGEGTSGILAKVGAKALGTGANIGKMGATVGVTEGALTTATGGISGLTAATSLLNPAVLAAVVAVGGGTLAYELWGKKAIESADRTKRWGASVDKSTDESATSFKKWSTDATLALNDTASNTNKNAADIANAFNGMTKVVEHSAKKHQKAIEEWAKSFGNSKVSEAVLEEADKENKAMNKHVAKVQSYNKQIQEIVQRAKEKHVKITDDERVQIAALQQKMTEEQVKLLNVSKSKKALILKAELSQANELTSKELSRVVQTTADSLEKERQAYVKQKAKIKQALKDKALTQAEANAGLEALQKSHNDKMNAYGIAFINAEKQKGYSKKRIMQDMLADTKMSWEQIEKVYNNYEKKSKKLNAVSIDTTQKMSKQTKKFASEWNSLVIDPKTMNVKSNVVDEVTKAVKSKDEWNKIKFLEKKGKLSTNAKGVVAEALVQSGKWDAMTWKQKEAWITYKGAEDVAKALTDNGKWNSLPMKAKQALVSCKGSTDLAKVVADYKLWNYLPTKEKDILVRDKDASKILKKAGVNVDNYNKKNINRKNLTGNAASIEQAVKQGRQAIDSHNRKGVSTKFFNGNPSNILNASGQSRRAVDAHNWKGVSTKHFNGNPWSVLNASSQARGSVDSWNRKGANSKSLHARDNASQNAHSAIRSVNAWNNQRNPKTVKFTSIFEKIFVTKKRRHKRFGTRNFEGGPMMVNDQQGPVFRELVQFPGGFSFIPQGRNVSFEAPKGTKVLKASETARKFPGLPQFAEGTVKKPTFDTSLNYLRAIDNVSGQASVSVDNSETNNRLDAIVTILSAIMNGTLNVQLPQSQVAAMRSTNSKVDLRRAMQDMNTLTTRQTRGCLNV